MADMGHGLLPHGQSHVSLEVSTLLGLWLLTTSKDDGEKSLGSWEVEEAPTYKQTNWTSRNRTLDENKIEELALCFFEEASCDSEEMPRPRIGGILNQMLTDWPAIRVKHARVNQQPFVQDFVRDDDWMALKVALKTVFFAKGDIAHFYSVISHDKAISKSWVVIL